MRSVRAYLLINTKKHLPHTGNYLNLPEKITQNSKVTDYTYRADGVKVKKIFDSNITDYLDDFQYENSILKFFLMTEGYLKDYRVKTFYEASNGGKPLF